MAALDEIRHSAIQTLRTYASQIDHCAALLSDSDLWRRENEHCNSVGNLLLHLNGNVREWVLGGLGGATVARDRAAEFAAGAGAKADLSARLSEAVRLAIDVIETTPTAAWEAKRRVRSVEVTGCAAVLHAVEHFAFHAGQIIHMTKVFRNVDLSL